MMIQAASILLIMAATIQTAEISSSYSSREKHASFNPDLKTEAIENHNVLKKDLTPDVIHPVFRAENERRARIEMVKSEGPVVMHDMADQPGQGQPDDRIDNLAIPNYAYMAAPPEVAYPDYAPAYGYDNGYAPSNSYDVHSNGLGTYMLEPDTSALSLLWSQMPDSRTIVGFFGRTIAWVFNSIFVILLGSLMTVGICSYTNLCTIAFHGVGPINEVTRSFITPEKLETIGNAADFVKTAIDKYQTIQKVTDGPRNRRSVVF